MGTGCFSFVTLSLTREVHTQRFDVFFLGRGGIWNHTKIWGVGTKTHSNDANELLALRAIIREKFWKKFVWKRFFRAALHTVNTDIGTRVFTTRDTDTAQTQLHVGHTMSEKQRRFHIKIAFRSKNCLFDQKSEKKKIRFCVLMSVCVMSIRLRCAKVNVVYVRRRLCV